MVRPVSRCASLLSPEHKDGTLGDTGSRLPAMFNDIPPNGLAAQIWGPLRPAIPPGARLCPQRSGFPGALAAGGVAVVRYRDPPIRKRWLVRPRASVWNLDNLCRVPRQLGDCAGLAARRLVAGREKLGRNPLAGVGGKLDYVMLILVSRR